MAEGAAAWWGAAHLPQLRSALRDSLARAVRHDYGHVASRTQVLDTIQHGVSGVFTSCFGMEEVCMNSCIMSTCFCLYVLLVFLK